MFCRAGWRSPRLRLLHLDQDRLARLQFQCVFDRADRRQPGKRQRSGIDMRLAVGFLCDDGCLDRNLLGIGALLANVADGEDLIADTDIPDTFPNRRNDTGEIPSKNVGEFRKLARFPSRTFQSAPLTLAATISTTTSPDAATGSSISPNFRTSGPPCRSMKAAFIVIPRWRSKVAFFIDAFNFDARASPGGGHRHDTMPGKWKTP